MFMREIPGNTWTHEHGSIDLLRHLLQVNGISLAAHGLEERDLTFIEEMIIGTPYNERKGRGPEKVRTAVDIVSSALVACRCH